jgi:hypothetical protein
MYPPFQDRSVREGLRLTPEGFRVLGNHLVENGAACIAWFGGMIEVMNEVVVEVEGSEKPACVAESLSRMVF